jgi:hypothetical protein
MRLREPARAARETGRARRRDGQRAGARRARRRRPIEWWDPPFAVQYARTVLVGPRAPWNARRQAAAARPRADRRARVSGQALYRRVEVVHLSDDDAATDWTVLVAAASGHPHRIKPRASGQPLEQAIDPVAAESLERRRGEGTRSSRGRARGRSGEARAPFSTRSRISAVPHRIDPAERRPLSQRSCAGASVAARQGRVREQPRRG